MTERLQNRQRIPDPLSLYILWGKNTAPLPATLLLKIIKIKSLGIPNCGVPKFHSPRTQVTIFVFLNPSPPRTPDLLSRPPSKPNSSPPNRQDLNPNVPPLPSPPPRPFLGLLFAIILHSGSKLLDRIRARRRWVSPPGTSSIGAAENLDHRPGATAATRAAVRRRRLRRRCRSWQRRRRRRRGVM